MISAVSLFLLLVQAGPADEPFERTARIARELRERSPAQAVAAYRQALKLNPAWDEGWWDLGTLLYSRDDPEAAIKAFEHVIQRHPENGGAWAFTGLSHFELQRFESALDALGKARRFGVGDNQQLGILTRYTFGILLNRASRFDEARRELTAVVGLVPADQLELALGLSAVLAPFLPSQTPADIRVPALLAGRALSYAAAGKRDAATALYQTLIERFGDAPNIHYAYGVFLLRDHADDAMRQFAQELAVQPAHVPSLLQVANEHLRRGEYREALPHGRRAAEIGPDWYLTRQMYGRALLEADDVAGAIRELEAAVQLGPENPENHFHLARAYSRAGREKDAAAQRESFLRLQASGTGSQRGSTPQPRQ